jgi:hypothetical protein
MARIYSKANTASEVLRMTKSENLTNLIPRKWYSGFKGTIAGEPARIQVSRFIKASFYFIDYIFWKILSQNFWKLVGVFFETRKTRKKRSEDFLLSMSGPNLDFPMHGSVIFWKFL